MLLMNEDSNLTLSSGGSDSGGKGSRSKRASLLEERLASLSEKERKEARAVERAQQRAQKARRAEMARLGATLLTEKARDNLRLRQSADGAASEMGGIAGSTSAAAPSMLPPSLLPEEESLRDVFGSPQASSVHMAGACSKHAMTATKDAISPPGHGNGAPRAEEEVRCNCRKSRCLKLYCDCFRKQHFCTGDCRCTDCENNLQYEESRTKAIRAILEGRPDAFKPRVDASKKGDGAGGIEHLNGCHCKKSACLKKYCECFGAKVFCGKKCRCTNCRNLGPDGTKTGGDSSTSDVSKVRKTKSVNSSVATAVNAAAAAAMTAASVPISSPSGTTTNGMMTPRAAAVSLPLSPTGAMADALTSDDSNQSSSSSLSTSSGSHCDISIASTVADAVVAAAAPETSKVRLLSPVVDEAAVAPVNTRSSSRKRGWKV